MSGIFDETNMRRVLGEYVPSGESLLAGIHAVSHEMAIKGIFGACARMEDRLVPDENGSIIELNKSKYATCDIYIGITQSSLVISGCERESYYYEFKEVQDAGDADVRKVTSNIFFADIGNCYPLADILSCTVKKGWMGSVKCFLTMKDGSSFKLMFPKLGGLGKGMPHHAKYREEIIARLGGGSA